MMAIQGSLATKVEQSYFGDSRRSPVLSGFRGDIYQWLPNWRVYVLVDDQRVSAPPISGTVSPPRLNVDASLPTAATVADLHFQVRQLVGLRPQDVVCVLPNMPVTVPSLDVMWEQWSVEERDLWERQLLLNIESHWYLLKGFDVNNGFLLPPGYQYLGDSCGRAGGRKLRYIGRQRNGPGSSSPAPSTTSSGSPHSTPKQPDEPAGLRRGTSHRTHRSGATSPHPKPAQTANFPHPVRAPFT